MGRRIAGRPLWKILAESVVGTSHVRFGTPCQDSCIALATRPFEEEFLVLACADGAGSAAHSDVGSRVACETFSRYVCDHLQSGKGRQSLEREFFAEAYARVQSAIADEAQALGTSDRDLACTLLTAIIGEHEAAFAQIGDGGMVVSELTNYQIVFWPDRGEYADTTVFVTTARIDEVLQYDRRPAPEAIVAFTDGLQSLALNYADRSPFRGFVDPMVSALRSAEDASELVAGLQAFLDSAGVNERTDDDKSLVLAVRVGGSSVTV
jgi:hypothetical protein